MFHKFSTNGEPNAGLEQNRFAPKEVEAPMNEANGQAYNESAPNFCYGGPAQQAFHEDYTYPPTTTIYVTKQAADMMRDEATKVLHAEIETLYTSISSLRQELNDRERLINSLQRTLREANKNAERLIYLHDTQMKVQRDAMQAANEDHRQSIVRLSNDNEALMRSHKGLGDRIKHLEQRERDLLEELDEAQKKLDVEKADRFGKSSRFFIR